MEPNHAKLKKRPTKVEEMTKEQIRQAITKKRECNAKAQQIVESLLEDSVSDAYLLQCLPHINQSHFEDIIEERSITQTCGYPICRQKLKSNDIPKQKYRISLKTNKVYDITIRKNFCSNECYKAAMHVKIQMLTSPLWFREYEKIPIFHLLPLDSPGSIGQEVDVAIYKNRVKVQPERFASINDFANATLSEMTTESNAHNKESHITTDQNTDDKPLTTKKDHNNEKENLPKVPSNNKIEQVQNNVTENNIKSKVNDIKKPIPNPLNIVGEVIEKPEKKVDPILLSKPEIDSNKPRKVLQKKQPLVTALTIEVEKCLAEWFTLDTMLFIFGDEKVREMVTDKGECIKEYLNNYAKGIFYSSNTYDQYQQLCKKLNMLELKDQQYDAETLQRAMKPLPDYSILQEESKKLQLKVKAFFSGETEIPESEPTKKSNEEEPENTTHLPLVDKNAQNALRRRIVCQHLDKVLPDLLRSLGLLTLTISSEVRLLVNTFKLKANNIMFKPIQWTLIAIVFIKLLSIRDGRLEHLLKQQMAHQHMQLLLLSYKQDGGYLDRLISWLTDIDRLLDTDNKQLTL